MGRTVIVGDVHGCRRELELLLEAVGFTAGDRLVFVGDLVARGPDSLGVLDVARRTGAVVVRGNHEDKLLAWRDEGSAAPHRPPTRVTLGHMHLDLARSLRPVDWSLLETSPYFYDLPEHGLRVVHAGVQPGLAIESTPPSTLTRVRTLREDGSPSAAPGATLWGARYVGPPHVVFGHNAAPGLQLHRWATGLDTGCVYGKRLTAMVLEAGARVPASPTARRALLVSQAAARVYYQPASATNGRGRAGAA
jgi:hypothetical protein